MEGTPGESDIHASSGRPGTNKTPNVLVWETGRTATVCPTLQRSFPTSSPLPPPSPLPSSASGGRSIFRGEPGPQLRLPQWVAVRLDCVTPDCVTPSSSARDRSVCSRTHARALPPLRLSPVLYKLGQAWWEGYTLGICVTGVPGHRERGSPALERQSPQLCSKEPLEPDFSFSFLLFTYGILTTLKTAR